MNGADGKGDVTRLLRAVRFASEKHRDHRRKGRTAAPYINHPIAVAEQLARAGHEQNTDLLMAAVLHDVVEDTETTSAELETLFGGAVAKIVMEVTDDKSLHEKDRKRLAVESISAKSADARVLKLSDLIANVHDVIHQPPNWSRDRKKRYFDWCEKVAGKMAGIHPVMERHLSKLLVEGRRAVG